MSEDCAQGTCQAQVCEAPSCEDGVKNLDETDVDCGGLECEYCTIGKACTEAFDCFSELCSGSVCVTTCNDGMQQPFESDVDCGGPECTGCGLGFGCNENVDCLSNDCDQTTLLCR